MSENTSNTFSGWGDRITWLLAEGQLLVLGLLFSVGSAIFIFRPDVPSVPPIAIGWMASLMLFGPPLFAFFVVFVRKLRQRRMVEVHQVNARTDDVEKWYVEPSVWSEKSVDGPNPYPLNGGSAWGVQEFDYDEELGELRVRGVWLEECEDTKLLTAKSHFESIYEKLTESHIALNVMRDSVSELGADIQKRIVNTGAEAREKGTMLDETAVTDVFESFADDIDGLGSDDLPTIETEDIAQEVIDEPKGSEPAHENSHQEAPITND